VPPVDARTPVIVGVGTAGGRPPDGSSNPEALELMVEACRRAGDDAGAPGLLARAGTVIVPRGTWRYHDAPGLIAQRLGAEGAWGVVADIGVLQTTLIARAADAIARGDTDVAVVVGAEARWREIQARRSGKEAADTDDSGGVPDEIWSPDHAIIAEAEAEAGLVDAPSQYSLLENALRVAEGQTLAQHQHTIAALWAGFNRIARTNPQAWNALALESDDLEGDRAGRLLAFPYHKWHVSQWNVDQAGCVLLCAAETARQLGVSSDRWIFPHAIAWSDHMIPISQRAQPHRSPGFEVAGRAALRLAGVDIDDVAHLDLYSCFPIAVRQQVAALNIGPDRPLTVTGGMTFAGGPLNNYTLQSLPAMVHRLRAESASVGLVTAVSGLMTKQGVSLWGTDPPAEGYRSQEVGAEVAAMAPTLPLVKRSGEVGTIATYTVLAGGDGSPATGVVVADLAGGARVVAANGDVDLAHAMTTEEWCGRSVVLEGATWLPTQL
jgi:acetyl-CoA C-acetyltransferase